jgi:uncharacterized LabA/DUF88 family protein
MSEGCVVGILVDAENLASWGERALEKLVARAAREGEVVYRRAYADWATGGRKLAGELSRLGFELVQVHHPAARKNSADIHMTVDAMDLLALDPALRTFVLATGDSDFAPLFRRLRERRRRVIGAGPRSCLSEAVESSCVEFLYMGESAQVPPAAKAPAAKAPAKPPPAAKAPAKTAAAATPLAESPPVAQSSREVAPPPAPTWRSLLLRWGWARVTPEQLETVHAAMRARGPATRVDHVANVVLVHGEEWATPARKVYALLSKAGLVEKVPETEGQAHIVATERSLADRVDAVLLGRVRRAIAEHGLAWDDVLLGWLVGPSDAARLADLAACSEREIAA